ncbi:MAG TPA: branched-chain amino acid transport system II carrier protein [Clostridiales bacterium]|nr:branched-chain amino acid transport system II carrier protein [Clostridiales bacterium]
MKKNLTVRDYIYVASMLFGLFFGAGNLIFPVRMGQMAGVNVLPAILGFLITGVGLPLLGVAALGISRCEGLYELSGKVDRRYGLCFTCLLYLTIGPFFAIPRCATTSFTVGIESMLPEGANLRLWLLLFTVLFFGAALFFSLFPGKILTWVGKILNPLFLLFLCVLIVVALTSASGGISSAAEGSYASSPFPTGFLEGYNTMDALASLAFGIVVVRAIRDLGVTDAGAVAGSTVRAGVFSCLFMALIYVAVSLVGAFSRSVFPTAENGGIALAQLAEHHLGRVGLLILAATVTLACLKTSVGLITGCAETFSSLFPRGPKYRVWAVIFSLASFLFANLGLDRIISYSVPVLMFLYPLAITLILLALFGRFFDNDRVVYLWVTGLTLIGAVYDLLCALPQGVRSFLHMDGFLGAVADVVPLASLGLAWLCPALLGLVIGICWHLIKKRAERATM